MLETSLQIEYQKFLEALAELLDITPSQLQTAKERYNAVGDWLSKPDSPIRQYSPEIYPQGSIRLGTIIKPLNGEDEFDIDLVCNLKLSKEQTTQKQLKHLIGDRLKANADYKRMLREEGKRCWTLEYQDSPKFHLDILPSIDDNKTRLNSNISYTKDAICITDKDSNEYSTFSDNWHKSNPKGFDSWFRDQMKLQFNESRKIIASKRNIKIEQVKEDEIKTPLQRAVQILKRHRDIMFGDDEDRPISIIITTLAARAYSEESNLYLALKNILDRMHIFIREVNGISVVENPVNPLENFADKWISFPQRKENFYAWMKKAKEDIYELIDKNGYTNSIINLREVFGKKIVNETLNKVGLGHLVNNTSIATYISPQLLSVPHKESPMWNMKLINTVSIGARYKDSKGWHSVLPNVTIPKFNDLMFTAHTTVPKPFSVFWQVVNTGEEARIKNSLRGQIFPAKSAGKGGLRHKEMTQYSGTHWIECFIVRDGVCLARSNEFLVKIV